MKSSVGLLLGVGAAVVAYAMWRKNQAANPSMPLSNPSNGQPSQPSQQYPWSPITPARVDNSNQPWYVGSTAFKGGPVDSLNATVGTLKAGSSVVHSLSDVWGDFTNFFGGNTAQDNLQASTDDWDMWTEDQVLGPASDNALADWDISDSDTENEVAWA